MRLEIEDHSGGWLALGDGATSLALRVGRPGAYWLAPSRVRLRDPLGVFERRMLVGRVESLLILPKPLGPASIRLRPPRLIDDPEPQGLQPYAPGMSLARIHWPALARGAGLHVRQFAPPPDGLPLVVVDTVGVVDRRALEWTARAAAGYVLTLARRGGCRVLLPGDAEATNIVGSDGAWRAVHRRLATLGDLPPPIAPSWAAGAATVRVRAVAAPAKLAAAPPLPHGVRAATACAPRR
jgi:uncharacterized protein (DUF58 family)